MSEESVAVNEETPVEEAPTKTSAPNGEFMLPKEAVMLHECSRCGCKVFQPCSHILVIDAKKAEEMGFSIPSNPSDPLNNGPFRFIQQEANIFACVGCGRKYRSEEIIMSFVKSRATSNEPVLPKVNSVTEKPCEAGSQPEG